MRQGLGWIAIACVGCAVSAELNAGEGGAGGTGGSAGTGGAAATAGSSTTAGTSASGGVGGSGGGAAASSGSGGSGATDGGAAFGGADSAGGGTGASAGSAGDASAGTGGTSGASGSSGSAGSGGTAGTAGVGGAATGGFGGASGASGSGGSAGTGGAAGTGGSSGSTGSGGAGGSGGASSCPTDLFLLDTAGMMHRFDPRTSQYRQIGEPDCYLGVRGMAVDARGTIYLGDNIGDLHSWQEGATTCTNTGFSGYASMIYDVAPAFVADAPGALDESLFAADSTTLAQLALPGFTIGRSFTLAGTGDVILGGTGDGRLFAFRRSTGSLARVDPSSGAQSDVRVIDSRFSSYIGFAVWRQEAWIFKLASSFDRSTIMRYPLTSGSGVSEGTTPGFTVVAAATATCGASL